jgi:hypothetical protein
MTRETGDLEKRALELASELTPDGHVYPDVIYRLDEIIREACKRGYEQASVELADAYSLFIVNDDDLDSFRDALTERVPEGWTVPEPRLAQHGPWDQYAEYIAPVETGEPFRSAAERDWDASRGDER